MFLLLVLEWNTENGCINEDIISIILQFLNPKGNDVFHCKIVCSSFKTMVEKVVPLHHIISIFQSILHHDQTIPSLLLPSNYNIEVSSFDLFFKTVEQTWHHELCVHHLVTTFILLFHNHPMIAQFLRLPHNSIFLMQLAKENYFPTSPLFQQLQTIHQLVYTINSNTNGCCTVSHLWIKEKRWNATFLTPYHIYNEYFYSRIYIPKDEVLMNRIIENKELLLFLLCKCSVKKCMNLVNCLLLHYKWKEYKIDWRVQFILCSYLQDARMIKQFAQE